MSSAQSHTHVGDTPFAHVDCDAFERDIAAMRRDAQAALGPADVRHLRRIVMWGRLCTLAGYAMAPWFFNPLAALLISQGNLTRWLLMHHISHRGYDRVPGIPPRFTSRLFARGWRRFIDWFDWILPEAWAHEHNTLHHYHTGQLADPDLVEEMSANSIMRHGPMWRRYLVVAFFAFTWKISYYAPNTWRTVVNSERAKRNEAPIASWWTFFNPLWSGGRTFWRRCVLPYGLVRFVILPALFLPLGTRAALWALVNSVVAEALTNLHTFAVIAPNHAGGDVYRFSTASGGKTEHYIRQVVGSVNYHCGSDGLDYSQMWLNYQIEHHLWPDLPMLQYRYVQPKVRNICAKYGLPYVQNHVLVRVRKLLDVMVGKDRMHHVSRVTAARPQAQSS